MYIETKNGSYRGSVLRRRRCVGTFYRREIDFIPDIFGKKLRLPPRCPLTENVTLQV